MDFDARTGTGLRQRTVESIGYRIIDSTYPPGYRFAKQEILSAELGVSRTVVREALGLLRDKGLIESRPKVGTVVADFRSWNLLDPDVLRWSIASSSAPTTLSHVAEVRLVIEPEAARLAAKRRSDAAADELKLRFDTLATNVNDFNLYIQADLAFHDAIFRAAANPVLAQMAETIRVALEGSRRLTVQVPGGPATTIDHHGQVCRAICAQDGVAAATAMTELIEITAGQLLRMLESPAVSQPEHSSVAASANSLGPANSIKSTGAASSVASHTAA